MAAADPATGVAGPSLVEALRARKTAVQSISAASNGGRDSQGAVDAYVSRRRAIRRRHSAVNQGRGGRVVARHIYDRLPDHFHDLQTTLQTEFNLLKKATSKNIKNLHDTINLHQTYTMSLCSHVNSIYAKLAQLDRQIQTHCLYPHSQSDLVQLNAPEYDSDIDGQMDILLDTQPQVSSHAKNTEEDPVPVTVNAKKYSAFPQDSDMLESQSQSVPNHPKHLLYQDTEQYREQYQNNHRSQLEDISELEDEDEDWEDRQFTDTDLIDNHTTTTESD